MRKDLRDIAINSAASRYGSEHYRSILFWQTAKRAWPIVVIVGTVLGLWWAGTHLSPPGNAAIGFGVLALALLAGLYLGVRHLRSPYRRRRFRL